MDQIIIDIGKELLGQGVLGIAVMVLIWYIIRLLQELKDARANHKLEIAEKDKIIMSLQETRIIEMKSGLELASATKSTLEAFLKAVSRD